MGKNRDFSKFPNAITVLDNGNVGIGTSTPSGKLNLIGGELRWGFTSDLGALSYTDNKPMLQSIGATDFLFYTNATERMRITSGGNVGIGTSNPNRKLVVNSGIDGISAGISGSTYGIRFDNGGTNSPNMSTIHGVDSTLTGSYQPIMLNGLDVRFGTSDAERMRITSSGNIIAGPNGAATTARLTSYAGGTILSGTNDGIRLQAFEYSNGSRHTIAWGQDSSNLTLARFGLEWNSGTSQMNFVWRDMYNSSPGSTENMRLTAAGHLQIPNKVAFSVYQNSGLSRSGLMTYSSTILNRGNCVNLSNGRFTAPVAGAYQISFMGFQQTGTSGILTIVLYKNGVTTGIRTYQDDPNTGYGPHATISVVISLAANDYVYVSVDGGDIHGNEDGFFSGYLIG